MTKKENFNAIATILNEMGNHDFDEFLAHEVELLSRKRSTSKTPTKRQKENEVLKDVILATLTNEGVTVTELQAKNEELGALSNQRVSALLRQMIADGKVVKTVDKKKSYFALAE